MENDLKHILQHLGFTQVNHQSSAGWTKKPLDIDASRNLLSESQAIAVAESWAQYQLNQCAAAKDVFAAFTTRANGWEQIDQAFHTKAPLPPFVREIQAQHHKSALSSTWMKDFLHLLSRYGNREHTVFGAVLSDLMLAAHDKDASCCPNMDSGNSNEQPGAPTMDH